MPSGPIQLFEPEKVDVEEEATTEDVEVQEDN